MKPICYGGFKATAEGISARFSRVVSRRWEHLVTLHTAVAPDGRSRETVLVFAVGRSVRLKLHSGNFSGTGRLYAGFVAEAIRRAPGTATIDERTRDVARWGGADTEARLKRSKGLPPSSTTWLEWAQFYRARLRLSKALKATGRALEQNRGWIDALRLRQRLLEESGAGLKKLIAAANECVEYHPTDAEFRTQIIGLRLQANDARIVPEAEQRLVAEPDNYALGFALAGYFFRKNEYERAVAITDALANRPGAAEWRKGASEVRDYFQRYATSRSFRARERLRYWGIIAMIVLPLALMVGARLWGAYQRNRPADPTRNPPSEWPHGEKKSAPVDMEIPRPAEENLALKAEADAGKAEAQHRFARLLFNGAAGVGKNPAEGMRYLTLAAEQNYAPAVLALAERFRSGHDVEENHVRAIELLTQATELGVPRAAGLLGIYYRSGKYLEKDEKKAFELFQKAAAGGDRWGESMVGWSYENGRGVEKDIQQAMDFYRRAARGKDRWSQERLVTLLTDHNSEGFNPDEAWRWAVAGAQNGSTSLQLYYVGAVLNGMQEADGILPSVALGGVEKEAERGNPAALYVSAGTALVGWNRKVDHRLAAERYAAAAEKNHPFAMWMYARCLATGVGVLQDIAEAKQWRDRLGERCPPERLEQLDALIAVMETRLSLDKVTGSTGDRRPQPIWQEAPAYPYQKLKGGVGGDVVVEFVILKNGHTAEIRVVSSSEREFEMSAIAAVTFWRFFPALKDGELVNVRVNQLLEFHIDDEAASPELTPVSPKLTPASENAATP